MEEVVAYERIFSMSDPCLLRVQGPVFLKARLSHPQLPGTVFLGRGYFFPYWS